MPSLQHEFDWPDRAVIGTLGAPGARTFYLQVRAGTRVASVALEKQQSALLAEKIDELLDQLHAAEGNPFHVPTESAPELLDEEPLEPVEELFRTGTMALGWDPATAQIVLEAHRLPEADTEDPAALLDDEPEVADEMLVVRMPVGTARAFAQRTIGVVDAGRPVCSSCGNPMDPEGHDCPAED